MEDEKIYVVDVNGQLFKYDKLLEAITLVKCFKNEYDFSIYIYESSPFNLLNENDFIVYDSLSDYNMKTEEIVSRLKRYKKEEL